MPKQLKIAIILNHMFTGNYLDKNIGHEIINLFADDYGRNFIYLCKDGKFNRNDIDIENSVVIQVSRPKDKTGTLEVISVAKGLKLVNESNYFKYEPVSILSSEEEIDKKTANISPTYRGKLVYDIFRLNEKQQECCVTFEAEQIFIPNQPVYICHNGDKIKGKDCNAIINIKPSQQMREYILEGDSDFEELMKIIPSNQTNNHALWSLRDPKTNKLDTRNVYMTATDIYGIQSRELSYSNAFKYFIDEYPELLHEFCRERGCKLNLDKSVVVYREWNNIDILIDCNDCVIIIENKIFSGLNGVDGNKTQLDKYKEILEQEKINGEPNPFKNKNHIFILLTPNHNKIAAKRPWITIEYSEIYDFLKDKIESSPYKDDFHFVDFVKSLEAHSKSDYIKIVMHKKFVKAIQKTK